jgi:serine/threonine-protein kinase HipA
MRGLVYYNNEFAGIIEKTPNDIYVFRYDDIYFMNPEMPQISVTLPKKKQEYRSAFLFSFFSGLLAEGVNKELQCKYFKIDPEDEFTRLLLTGNENPIGAVIVKQESDLKIPRNRIDR